MTGRRHRPVPDSLFGGRLRGASYLELTVAEVVERSPRMRTLRFVSPDLVDLVWQPGQDIMIDVPGQAGVRRRYTVRRGDPRAGTIDVDVVLHGDGLFARWARSAAVGEVIEAIGPRGANPLRAGAVHHLFVGDPSAWGAIGALVEALPATSAATVLMVDAAGRSTTDEPITGAALHLAWLTPDDLDSALAAQAGPAAADGAAYVYGEASLVRSTAATLRRLGIDGDHITTKAYWRRDEPNAPHGEPRRDDAPAVARIASGWR